MSGGATAQARVASSPVGAIEPKPSRWVMSDSTCSMLLAVSSLRAESDWRPCSSQLLDAEVVHPLHVVVGEDVVGRDEHAELGCRADLVLERVDVGDGLGRLVDPGERVGLQLEVVLDGDAAGEDRRRWRAPAGRRTLGAASRA